MSTGLRAMARQGPPTKTRPVTMAMRSPGSILLITVMLAWVAFTPDYQVFALTAALPVALIGLGLLVLQGWAREISLVSAALFATSMYYFNYLHREVEGEHLPWLIAFLITLAIPTVLMAGLALASGKLPSIYLIILTLGLQITLEKTVFNVGYLSGGTSGGTGGPPLVDPRPHPFGINLVPDTNFYFFALLWVGVAMGALIRLRRSPVGLAFLLVGANRQAAAAVGIPPVRFRVLAFATAGLLAGLGGVLGSMLYVGPPLYLTYRLQESLLLLAIPVLAGVDSMAAILVVSSVMIVSPIVLERWRIDQNTISALLLGFGALLGPRGLGGRAHDMQQRWKHGDRRIRTKKKRIATVVLRGAGGLADERTSVLSDQERAECLAVLENWLPPRPTGSVALRADDINVTFGAIRALTGASIVVPAGDMVGLIGPNGAGKTTLFDVVSGFTPADSGRVELFGQDVTHEKPWNRASLGMSRTFQSTRVITELTVGDNMLAGVYQTVKSNPLSFIVGRRSAWDRMREAEEAAWAAARLLDVDRYWDERVGTLEFSARRRIEIARSILAGPRLLLLDEPAAGLDPASSSALFDLVRQLHQDLGLTVLIVEHYVKAVLDTCDLIYVLAQGAVLAEGSPAEIAANKTVQDEYLGTRLRYLDVLDDGPVYDDDSDVKDDPDLDLEVQVQHTNGSAPQPEPVLAQHDLMRLEPLVLPGRQKP